MPGAIEKKKLICREYKIRLIDIYPKDIYPLMNLDSKLASLLTIAEYPLISTI